jgi:serine/threonine protein kinase
MVAVKVVRKAWSKPQSLERLYSKWRLEAEIWSRFDHPNIAPFYGICFNLGPPSVPCLVCPYFKNGNIAEYLKQSPDADRTKLVSQVAAGLAYMHSLRIVHGDIKSSNILVNDRGEACIIDFGVSRKLDASVFTTQYVRLEFPIPSSDENNSSRNTTTFGVGGTRRWMACELLAPSDGMAGSAPQTTVATDIWAFGMTALEILSGHLPSTS